MILFEIQLRFFMAFTLIDEAFLSVLQYDNTLEIVPKRHRSQYNSPIYTEHPTDTSSYIPLGGSAETSTHIHAQRAQYHVDFAGPIRIRIAMMAHNTYSSALNIYL